MGGNLLNGQRMDNGTYRRIIDYLTTSANLLDGPVYFESPLSYSEKLDFGDVDLVASYNCSEADLIKFLSKTFGDTLSEFTISSNNGLSFLFEGKYQVDIIKAPGDFYFCLQYHDYNDLGGMIGGLCKSLGLKLRSSGLYYQVFDNNDRTLKVGEVLLSNNWLEVLHVVGLENRGFTTLKSIFRYVTSSPHFRYDAFWLENLTNKQRKRNVKRKTYMAFLDYIKENQCRLLSMEKHPVEQYTLSTIEPKWPEAAEKIKNLLYEHELNKEFKKKFNGNLVNAWTGLSGKELGDFMAFYIAMPWFKGFVADSTLLQIEGYIKSK